MKRDPRAGNLRRNQVYAYRSRGRIRYVKIVAVRPDPGMVVLVAARRDGRELGGVHGWGPLKGLPRQSYPQYCSFASGVMTMPPGFKLVAIAVGSVATPAGAVEARAA